MYTPVSMLRVRRGINKRWEDVSVDSTAVNVLMRDYRSIYVRVSLPATAGLRVLDMEQFAARYADYTGTLAQMFTDFADESAIEISTPMNLSTKVARFKDGRQAGYRSTAVHPTLGLNAPAQTRDDLFIERASPQVDYDSFIRYCMVSVNGFYHMIETDGSTGVWVKGGGKSRIISSQSQFGIYSFSSIGALSYIPITDGMLHKRLSPEMQAGTAPVDPFSKIGFIKLPQSMLNKTPIVVLGGYLFTPDSPVVSRVSDDEIQIDFQQIPMLARYYESKHYLDMSSLGLDSSEQNPSVISIDQLLSDEVLMKYMTLSQSFVVLVDTPELFVNRYFVRKTGTPGVHESYQDPKYPLLAGLGRMPEYWSVHEDGVWSLSCYDSWNRNKAFNTARPLLLGNASDASLPYDPELYYGACLVEIGRDLKK